MTKPTGEHGRQANKRALCKARPALLGRSNAEPPPAEAKHRPALGKHLVQGSPERPKHHFALSPGGNSLSIL